MDWLWYIIATLAALYVAYRAFLWPACCESKVKLSGRTVLITGGNEGIGKATAVELAKRDARVIIACQNEAKSEKVVKEIEKEAGTNNMVKAMKLDLGSLTSVREFVKQFRKEETRLDILVNNAGINGIGQPRSVSQDGIELHLAVNHLGHFLLTNLLLDMLKASSPSRVVNLASMGHEWIKGIEFDDMNLEQPPFSGMAAYCISKLANVLFTRELAERLKGSSVTTYAVHPGAVNFVDIVNKHWVMRLPGVDTLLQGIYILLGLDPYFGAQTSVYCSVAEELEGVSGKYYSNCEEKAPAPAGEDDEAAKRLWDISEKMTGL